MVQSCCGELKIVQHTIPLICLRVSTSNLHSPSTILLSPTQKIPTAFPTSHSTARTLQNDIIVKTNSEVIVTWSSNRTQHTPFTSRHPGN